MKNNQELFENLATIQALFPDTPKLRELCEPIYKFRTIVVTPVPHTGPIEGVKEWKDKARREISPLVVSEYGKPLEELVAYLRPQLPH